VLNPVNFEAIYASQREAQQQAAPQIIVPGASAAH